MGSLTNLSNRSKRARRARGLTRLLGETISVDVLNALGVLDENCYKGKLQYVSEPIRIGTNLIQEGYYVRGYKINIRNIDEINPAIKRIVLLTYLK